MKDLLRKFDDLLNRLQRLAAQQQKLMAELQQKEGQIASLKAELKSAAEQLNLLKEEQKQHKLGEVIVSVNTERRELRRKLNEYIREVDHVIEKLSGEG